MHGQAEGIAAEELLPQARREFVDPVGRMLARALQDVDQIVIGVDYKFRRQSLRRVRSISRPPLNVGFRPISMSQGVVSGRSGY
jgi:hypothetical protein